MQLEVKNSKIQAQSDKAEIQAKVQFFKEEQKARLAEAKSKILQSKQDKRRQIRAESIDNQEIISKINHVHSGIKRAKAQSIAEHERHLRRKRSANTRSFVEALDKNFQERCEKEVRVAQRSKQILKDLTDHEESLADSLMTTSQLAFVRDPEEDCPGMMATQVIKRA